MDFSSLQIFTLMAASVQGVILNTFRVSDLLSIIISAAAAATKLLQSCPTLCNSIDSSPPGSPVPGICQARVLEWGAISFSNA